MLISTARGPGLEAVPPSPGYDPRAMVRYPLNDSEMSDLAYYLVRFAGLLGRGRAAGNSCITFRITLIC